MNHNIISLDRLRREAAAAARVHSDINAACPYPFGTDAAHAFIQFFNEARQVIAQTQTTETA